MNKIIIFLLLLSLTLSVSSNYDSYILALQWGNGICEINTCRSGVLDSIDSNILTIHGHHYHPENQWKIAIQVKMCM